MAEWIGPAISAGASLFGGLLGNNAAQKSLNWQKHLARNQVQMRVADAKKAGISPLAALGASLYSGGWTSGNALGDGIAAAGQAIGDHVSRASERKMAAELHQASLDKLRAETAESQARAQSETANAVWTQQQAFDSWKARAAQGLNGRPTLGQELPQDRVVNGTVRGEPHRWEIPVLSTLSQAAGGPPIYWNDSGRYPSGQFLEDQLSEWANVIIGAEIAEQLGLANPDTSNPLFKLSPLAPAERLLRHHYRRRKGKEIRDSRRGRITR